MRQSSSSFIVRGAMVIAARMGSKRKRETRRVSTTCHNTKYWGEETENVRKCRDTVSRPDSTSVPVKSQIVEA